MNSRAHLIAGLIGPLLLAIAASILLNGDGFRTVIVEFGKSPALVFLSGIITLVAGLAIVRAHNVWSGGWQVIITIFGWLALIGGLVRIVFPLQTSALVVSAANSGLLISVFAVIPLALGAYLTWQGWRHVA